MTEEHKQFRDKTIKKIQFNKLTFESTYKTPFIIGQLQINDDNQQNKFYSIIQLL